MAKGKINLEQRCEILAALISGVQEAYLSATEEQKSFIETTIGAALWYLPTSEAHYISIELVKKFQNPSNTDVKVSKEHIYPRKISASELLKMPEINTEKLLVFCNE